MSFEELETNIRDRHSEIDEDVFIDFREKYNCQDCDFKNL